jgi:hypothetical protein
VSTFGVSRSNTMEGGKPRRTSICLKLPAETPMRWPSSASPTTQICGNWKTTKNSWKHAGQCWQQRLDILDRAARAQAPHGAWLHRALLFLEGPLEANAGSLHLASRIGGWAGGMRLKSPHYLRRRWSKALVAVVRPSCSFEITVGRLARTSPRTAHGGPPRLLGASLLSSQE